ncbi:MAG: hypothetical protein ACLFVJ_06060 [Persicimonas sp.]
MSSDSNEEQPGDDGWKTGDVIDPNVGALADRSGDLLVDDADDDEVVAALRADAAAQNKAETPGPRRTERPKLALDNVDLSPDMAITGNDYRGGDRRDDETDQRETDPKVSDLTMLGVEHMLGQNADRGGRRWLVPAVAVALLAAFLGGGYWLYEHYAGEGGMTMDSVSQSVERSVVIPIEDWWAGDRERFSTRGLQTVIEGAGWQPRGEAGTVETNDRREVRQTYHRDGARLDTVIHDTPERADARAILEQVDLPARALLFDTKVVVLRPGPDTHPDEMDGVIALLARYHEMILDEQ